MVAIHTDEGLTGIGETDVNPWIAQACIEAPGTYTMGLGLAEMLLGQDPMDVEAHWERLYVGSAMNGRHSNQQTGLSRSHLFAIVALKPNEDPV